MTLQAQKEIAEYYALRPLQYPVLRRLEIVQRWEPDETPETRLLVELASRELHDSKLLQLSFGGVRELTIVHPKSSVFEIGHLELTDVTGEQWEGIRFRARDTEDEALAFLCGSFQAAVVPRAEHD